MLHKLFIALCILSITEGPKKTDILIPPLDIPLVLSANFGELRTGHFHSGVDFKTDGVTGKNVYAAADGFVYRIVVSPTGFGRALYIRHPNGMSTVYGHLESFIPDIEDYVKEQQYRKRNFSVNIFPDEKQFTVNKGDLIAFSGNSGSSMGPHLHFEVRQSSGEKPLDPLQYYNIDDNIKPVINSVAIYPVRKGSTIKGSNNKLIARAKGSGGRYTINQGVPIRVSGPVGFGINAHDYLDNSWNKCGIRIVNLKVDDKLIYSHAIDEFSFSETRYINSHIDYEEKVRNAVYIQKTFLEPNNRLSIYNHVINDGIIEFYDGELHEIEIGVADFNDNYSSVTFSIKSDTLQKDEPMQQAGILMPFGQKNEIRHHDIRLSFPADCFYDSIYFDYRKAPTQNAELYSDIHFVHTIYTPVHSSYNIAIKPSRAINDALRDKLCLVYINERDMEAITYAGGEWNDGFIEGSVRELGIYAVGIDTLAPSVVPVRFNNNATLGEHDELKIRISDDFSGIGDYEARIDGEWALFEWDPKNSLLSYRPDPDYLSGDGKHSLELRVSDMLKNETVLKLDFYWQGSGAR
jgi:hypothetical protein